MKRVVKGLFLMVTEMYSMPCWLIWTWAGRLAMVASASIARRAMGVWRIVQNCAFLCVFGRLGFWNVRSHRRKISWKCALLCTFFRLGSFGGGTIGFDSRRDILELR